MSTQPQGLTLSLEQLKELLISMAQELRKPADPTPEQAAAIEQSKADRKATAQAALRAQVNRNNAKKTCTHLRSNGSTCAVYVQNMQLMICQHCQALVYPESMLKHGVPEEEGAVYDTNLFNRLLQLYSDSVGNV